MNDILIKKINDAIEAPIQSLGLAIVQISLKILGKRQILEILIENPSGARVTIANCQSVSKNIGVILDIEEIIKDPYHLEVSSAGIERPLVKLEDYQRFLNQLVKIKLKQSIEGRSSYIGEIVKVIGSEIYIKHDDKEIIINFELIKNAHLILTNEKFKQLLKASTC